MSHFVIAVLTKTGSDDEVYELMAPYHEFECTGRNDEFVKNVDVTDRFREDFESQTTRMYKDSNGVLHDAYQDGFYREFTPEETLTHGRCIGSGGAKDISWHSKDWGDGRGYRAKVHFVPDGMEVVNVPRCQVQSFRDFVEDWCGKKIVPFGLDPTGIDEFKYGYAIQDEKGNIVQVIDRTNPDSFWDWYKIGGRWDNYLFEGNRCKVSDFPAWPEDWDAKNKFFGIITPDGVYHSKGQGGWWGAVHDEKDDWAEIEAQLLAKYPDSIAVVVDFHV